MGPVKRESGLFPKMEPCPDHDPTGCCWCGGDLWISHAMKAIWELRKHSHDTDREMEAVK